MYIWFKWPRSSMYEIIQNFNLCIYRNFIDLGLLRSGSVFFPYPSLGKNVCTKKVYEIRHAEICL